MVTNHETEVDLKIFFKGMIAKFCLLRLNFESYLMLKLNLAF